jgi:hypothetical protein
VQIIIPADWVLDTPSLLFGGVKKLLITKNNTTKSQIYTCMTPQGVTGLVSLSLYDSQYENSAEYPLGLYRYENPAEITAISPTSMMIGIYLLHLSLILLVFILCITAIYYFILLATYLFLAGSSVSCEEQFFAILFL